MQASGRWPTAAEQANAVRLQNELFRQHCQVPPSIDLENVVRVQSFDQNTAITESAVEE